MQTAHPFLPHPRDPAESQYAARLRDPGMEAAIASAAQFVAEVLTEGSWSPADAESFFVLVDAHSRMIRADDPVYVLFEGGSGETEEALTAARENARRILTAGACAMFVAPEGPSREWTDALIHLAFCGTGSGGGLRGGILGGLRIPTIEEQVKKYGFARFDWLLHSQCSLGLTHALEGGGPLAKVVYHVWTDGIERIEPQDACGGEEVTIYGNFGSGWMADTKVSVPVEHGRRALVDVRHSPDALTITLPSDVASGPIWFHRMEITPGRDPAQVAGALGDALAECGMGGGSITLGAFWPSPPQLGPTPGGENILRAGPPTITRFHANNVIRLELRGRSEVMLIWAVERADRVEIVTSDPKSGPHELPSIGRVSAAPGHVLVTVPSTFPWVAHWELRASNRCGEVARRIDVRMRSRDGIVLSGGGTMGSFQVGALKYLYDVCGIRPEIVAGSSVGALNAAKLAEGEWQGAHAAARLEKVWRRLETERDMYELMPWVENIQNNDVKRLFIDGAWLGVATSLPTIAAFALLGEIGLAAKFGWDMVALALALNEAQFSPCILHPWPLEELLHDLDVLDANRVASSGIKLRVSAVGLQRPCVVYIDEHGRVREKGSTDVRGTTRLVNGILASAAIPVVFPPRDIFGEQYIDGGVRDVIPIEAVVNEAENIYAIHASSPMTCSSVWEPKSPPWFGVHAGAHAVMQLYDEASVNDTRPTGGWPSNRKVHVIRPTIEVHDFLMIDPGLIDISIDYGWMRAADVLSGAKDSTADEITKMRLEAWKRELGVYGRGVPQPFGPDRAPSQNDPTFEFALLRVRELKRSIHATVQQRKQEARPPGYERWYREWEKHRTQPADSSPWIAFTFPPGVMIGSMPPPG